MYSRVCLYTVGALLGGVTGATEHTSESPHSSVTLDVITSDTDLKLSDRRGSEILVLLVLL